MAMLWLHWKSAQQTGIKQSIGAHLRAKAALHVLSEVSAAALTAAETP
jgi:hypothetical protein